jgi:hypothetical protein
MAKNYPDGFDSKEQHDAYLAALESELAVLEARKSPRAKEVKAELAKHKPARAKADSAD